MIRNKRLLPSNPGACLSGSKLAPNEKKGEEGRGGRAKWAFGKKEDWGEAVNRFTLLGRFKKCKLSPRKAAPDLEPGRRGKSGKMVDEKNIAVFAIGDVVENQ